MDHWILKTVATEDLSYISNDGHADNLTEKYVYDNFVPNCLNIKKGDVAVIVNKKKVLGLAKISRILISNSSKIRRRCPECNNTNYEERKTKLPMFRCNKGHEFEEPIAETAEVTQYEAFYKEAFILPSIEVTVDKIKPYYQKGYNRNMSMQNLSKDFFEHFFNKEYKLLFNEVNYPEADDADNNLLSDIFSDDYVPNGDDERSKIYRSIVQRRGQKNFRDAVRELYGDKCVITGCEILDILEAAHINPYKGEKDNHAANGLLLRADIHTLFDLDLIGIEPNELKVHLNEVVRKDGYEVLENKVLLISKITPNKEALKIRWKKFLSLCEL